MGYCNGFYFLSFIAFLLIIISKSNVNSTETVSVDPLFDLASLNRHSFPPAFIFGAGSSSYQFEGAATEGGRQPSIWDTFTHRYPEKIKDNSNGDLAIDTYHQYKEDVSIMKDMNLDSYRFSISWSRILPKGKLSGGINQEGVAYYNNLINELLANGIQPLVTLFHWDLPQTLEDEYGGFLSPLIMFMDPLTFGDYPKSMRSLVGVRLPKFTTKQSRQLMGSFDFIGLNYYSTTYASDAPLLSDAKPNYLTDSLVNPAFERNGKPIGIKVASDWLYVYPKGIRDLLLYTKKKYNNPLIYVTENGINEYDDPTLSVQESLMDIFRIDYHFRHLFYLRSAIIQGANVKGYYVWSLFDNFEWSSGYTVRFGMTFVDYKNYLKRYKKLSALWFKSFLKKETKLYVSS